MRAPVEPAPPRSRVIDAFDWGAIGRRRTLARHGDLRAARQGLHPSASGGAGERRGKYLGLTVPPVIEHLKSIGVTAVELLPCQAFESEDSCASAACELLGLQPDCLVRARERVRRAGRGARIQDHGQGAASRRASRSFWTWSSITPPRATRRAGALVQGHRQRGVLPPDAGQAPATRTSPAAATPSIASIPQCAR
jgi:hypothetical protein